MRRWLTIVLLGALLVSGCRDNTGGARDRGPAVGDKAPRSPSPTTGNRETGPSR